MPSKGIEKLRKMTNLELVTDYSYYGDSAWGKGCLNEINYRIHMGTFKVKQGVYDYSNVWPMKAKPAPQRPPYHELMDV